MWLAKLTEKGLLRPSFVPPPPIRQLRDYTRLREDLTRERTRYWQRLEKLLEDALIKVSSVTSTLNLLSVRDMLEALIAGQRDPRRLADLARGRLTTKHAALVAALDGRFDAHHAELTRMLLDQIDALTAQIDTLTRRIEALITAIDEPHTGGGEHGGQALTADPQPSAPDHRAPPQPGGVEVTQWLSTIERLDEITGIGPSAAQVILAEIGWDMSRFPTPAHLVSWAKLCPRTIQSGPVIRGGKTGKGNPYILKAYSARPPRWPPEPTPSSVNATAASSNAAAGSRPWSRSPAPSWSSSGTCWPIPTPASATSAPTTTPAASSPNESCAATSHNSPRSATESPSNPPPRRPTYTAPRHHPAPPTPGHFACSLTSTIYRSVRHKHTRHRQSFSSTSPSAAAASSGARAGRCRHPLLSPKPDRTQTVGRPHAPPTGKHHTDRQRAYSACRGTDAKQQTSPRPALTALPEYLTRDRPLPPLRIDMALDCSYLPLQ